jgi:lysophospholipase L1-like esterase
MIKRKVRKLSAARGNSGISGNKFKRIINILILGESTMAGVGITKHQDGFPGTLAKELSENLKVNVQWNVYAKSGFTAKQLTKHILPRIRENNFDLIIIGLGGNDAFALRSPGKWKKHIHILISDLRSKYKNAPIAFLNMPPIKDFPAFSLPLKITLGNLSLLLGKALNDLVLSEPNVYFNEKLIRVEEWKKKYNEQNIFSDGVHPSEITYRLWAKDFAEFLLSINEIKNILNNKIFHE